MSCCLENAVIDALRALDCTKIRSENHFLNRRKCKDCTPYAVVKVRTVSGLRTSSAVQKISTIEVSAFFNEDREQDAIEYKDLVEGLFFASECVTLASCGCFCVQGRMSSSITPAPQGLIRYSFTCQGFYRESDSDSSSESVSESV